MRFSKLLGFFGVAIASLNLTLSAFAQTNLPSSCRATKVDTPIFQEPSTTSNAIRIIPRENNVTLAFLPASGDRFVRIQSPVAGFIQTGVLKYCATSGGTNRPWERPTIGNACRRIVRPEIGLVVRREPRTQAALVTTLYPITIVFVNITTGNAVKSYRNENFDWVEIDLARSFPGELTGTGWVVNTNVGSAPGLSNLGYCT